MSDYLFHAVDRPGMASLRAQQREAHRTYIRQDLPSCRCVLGGALHSPDGEMIGTALVFRADSREAVATFMAADPYMVSGLFDHVDIQAWRIGLGEIA